MAAATPSSPDTPDAAAPPRRRRRLWPWFVLLTPLLLASAAAWLGWVLYHPTGSLWLIERLPGVQVMGAKGTLLGGDFDAGQIEITLPRDGRLLIDGLSWRGLHIEYDGDTTPSWRLVIDRLAAQRVELRAGTAAPAGAAPTEAPRELALPIELRIEALQINALHAPGLGGTPLRELQARVHLAADQGRVHRLEGVKLGYGALRASGSATLGSTAPLALDATLALTQETALANAQWSAQLQARGPLAEPAVQATLRAQPADGKPAQSLDLRATLRPFARWPLGALDARFAALDLSAFHPALPVTALSGEALAETTALDQPARLTLALRNTDPGLWNAARLPLQRLALELKARPDDPATLQLSALEAEFGTPKQPAGRLQGHGRFGRDGWSLETTLTALQPSRLDARAAAIVLSGPLHLRGEAPTAAAQALEVKAELAGVVGDKRAPRKIQLRLDAKARRDAKGDLIELREATLGAGDAKARLVGSAEHSASPARWLFKGKLALNNFDPQPWWPGREDSPWRRGPHQLNAQGQFDLTLALPAPASAAASAPPRASTAAPSRAPAPRPSSLAETLAPLRGSASLTIAPSRLAGVPLQGEATLRADNNDSAQLKFDVRADSNRVFADAALARRGDGGGDRWELGVEAPALTRLTPLWQLLRGNTQAALGGSLNATAQLSGRWPALTTRGDARAEALRIDTLLLEHGTARWQAGSDFAAPVTANVELRSAAVGAARFDTVRLQLQGTGRAHTLELRAESKAQPPAWIDTLRGVAATGKPGVALVQAQGGLLDRSGRPVGWRGRIDQIDLRALDSSSAWLRSNGVAIELLGLDVAPLRLTVQPGRAEVAGAALRWSRINWQAASGSTAGLLDAEAELEPLPIAPLLARLQPDFGWGGDLAVGGKLQVHSAPTFQADIVIERSRGDLTVTDELGTQSLGLTDLRLGLNVADGVWSFTQGLAGSTLGVAAGAFVARTTPQARWPAPDTPVTGVLELRVANLGTWGTWVPPGWRLGGALRISAGIGGRFAAPEYTGDIEGRGISVRNFLEGVNVSDGEVDIALQGTRASIERFRAKAGNGDVRLDGSATLGEAPQALLKLTAQKFQVLGRVDRRIVASGQAQLQLDRDKLALDGEFKVDEGLIDVTRSDAPKLSSDVVVFRGAKPDPNKPPEPPAPGPTVVAMPRAALDLRVDLGNQLRLRGRGLDTGLRGELRLTSPGGKLALNGTVRAVGGTYAAYGQKLEIDRGDLTFNGPVDNPRLDIEATRPNLDVRVGVAVGGTAMAPRVRLFSEPELSDLDKLSWLVLGRASEGLGRTDTALLQRAALALLAGDRESPTDQFTKALGLDEVSLRQSDGEVRETVITLGKQLSRRWYVGYERSLNATTGTWQLIYRVAQRFTLRAQAGEDSSLDLIWTWRWGYPPARPPAAASASASVPAMRESAPPRSP